MSEIQHLIDRINEFRDARNWRTFHNAKDLAISVSIESSELLEIFQWRDAESAVVADREHIMEELADVLIYCLMMADTLDMDVTEIVNAKLRKNAVKYPA